MTLYPTSQRREFQSAMMDRYSLYTLVIGHAVELHASDRFNGERFISRADDFRTAEQQLHRMITVCEAHKPPASTRWGQVRNAFPQYLSFTLERAVRHIHDALFRIQSR
jgi:hypothetical protein